MKCLKNITIYFQQYSINLYKYGLTYSKLPLSVYHQEKKSKNIKNDKKKRFKKHFCPKIKTGILFAQHFSTNVCVIKISS